MAYIEFNGSAIGYSIGNIGDAIQCDYHGKHRTGTIEAIGSNWVKIAQQSPEIGYRTFRFAEIENWENNSR